MAPVNPRTGKEMTGTLPDEGAPTKSDVARMKSEARNNPANQNPARSNTNTGPTGGYVKDLGSLKSRPTQPQRMITGLMGFTVIFALVGNEIKISQGQTSQPVGAGNVTAGGKIVIGGVFATTLLILLSHAGEGGAQFATGLALVSAVTAGLVYGGPVWNGASKLFGSQPTTPLASTKTTAPTTPTHGVGTAYALTQAVA